MSAAMPACGDSAGTTETMDETMDPDSLEVVELDFEYGPVSVLSGTLIVRTDVDTSLVSVVVDTGDESFEVPATGILSDPVTTEHRVMILGLREMTPYAITATVRHDDGEGQPELSEELGLITDPLPEAFPPLHFISSDPSRMEPGVTFFDSTAREGLTTAGGYLVAVDAFGEVVWYHTAPTVQQPCDLRRLSNGNLIFLGLEPNGFDSMAVEIDMLGNEVQRWTRADTGIQGMHGDLAEMPDGTILTSGVDMREISGYDGGHTFPVVGDTVVEFDLDGTITREISLHDVLDPYRIASQDFHGGFWIQHFGVGSKDWTHLNAVAYDPGDDTYLISARHQDIVFKMRREDGALVWLIGEQHYTSDADDDWPFLELIGDGTLPNHMHAPEMLENGNVLMFDNANESRRSRAVEYAIDMDAMTVEQVWEYTDPDYDPDLFSIYIGDADMQPGGTVLIDFGATLRDPMTLNAQAAYAHIVEVDKATGDKVFELDVRGEPEDVLQRLVYRADRQPSLYPSE